MVGIFGIRGIRGGLTPLSKAASIGSTRLATVGGGGGGKDDFAQGGGTDISKLGEAVTAIKAAI